MTKWNLGGTERTESKANTAKSRIARLGGRKLIFQNIVSKHVTIKRGVSDISRHRGIMLFECDLQLL
ncbi:hypothetical protein NL54_05680 [Pantoea stewartii]|nr:hypothetical protein NL54_05680 [Pantoea stewartii]KHN61790.1 hypothetical protein OI73_13045 [Pantoea stewartii]KTS28071.1 hypothetical protein NS381_11945 [Pantoea stewartii]